jgi:hypothetical protein
LKASSASTSAALTLFAEPPALLLLLLLLLLPATGCDNFRSMCVEGSPVAKCKLPGVTSIPTTTAVNAQVWQRRSG